MHEQVHAKQRVDRIVRRDLYASLHVLAGSAQLRAVQHELELSRLTRRHRAARRIDRNARHSRHSRIDKVDHPVHLRGNPQVAVFVHCKACSAAI